MILVHASTWKLSVRSYFLHYDMTTFLFRFFILSFSDKTMKNRENLMAVEH